MINIIDSITFPQLIWTLIAILVLRKINKSLQEYGIASSLLSKAQRKRKLRDAQIAQEFIHPADIPEEIKNLVLQSNVTQLSQLLNEGKVSSEQILNVYHSRAITIGLSLELIAESNYTEALHLARKCDETRKRTPIEERSKLGGLFGIPISIKDSFIQAGMDSTCGEGRRCFNPCPKDGEIIEQLKNCGAIPFIRSNVPQTLGILDCVNHIWGRGLNPWNKDRSIGGSSGGEGGLIASKCSPIGLGSDALGSIKIPAAFCGVCAFKPTRGRYVVKGHSVVGPYAQSKFSYFFPNNGPLGRCVDDLALFTKSLISEEGRINDPLFPLVQWEDNKYKTQTKLRIGYVLSEEFYAAAQPCQRAVKEATDALKKLGHEIVEVRLPKFDQMIYSLVSITSSEGGGKGLIRFLGGEKPVAELKTQVFLRTMPKFVKTMTKFLLKRQGHKRLFNLLQATEEVDMPGLHEKVGEFFKARDEFLQYWTDNNLDAMITPAMALPAFKHGHGVELALASCYNWPANIANLPSGVVPVTTVREGEDVYSDKDSVHKDRIFKLSQNSIQGSVGIPICVQVMTLPWEDEKCLSIMKSIESVVNFRDLPYV